MSKKEVGAQVVIAAALGISFSVGAQGGQRGIFGDQQVSFAHKLSLLREATVSAALVPARLYPKDDRWNDHGDQAHRDFSDNKTPG